MQREQLIQQLVLLKDLITRVNLAKSDVKRLQERYSAAVMKTPTTAQKFDAAHDRKGYVKSRAGDEPRKPADILKILPFIYGPQDQRYQKDVQAYNARVEQANFDFDTEFSSIRRSQRIREVDAIEHERSVAKELLQAAEEKLHSEQADLDEKSKMLNPELLNIQDISLLITFLRDQRADTMKEALNLLYEHKHRVKIEEQSAKQMQQIQQIKAALSSVEEQIANIKGELYTIGTNASEARSLAQSLSGEISSLRYEIDSQN